jgi:hypothetical protein
MILEKSRDTERKKYCSRSCRQKGRYRREGWDMAPVYGQRGPGHNPPKDARECEFCKREYQPNGTKQRWCIECVPPGEHKWKQYAYRYGISKPMWEAMHLEQDGTCALCDAPATVVDHCHRTGNTRKLLCNACNVALSRFERDGWAEKARVYVSVSK